ncbi:MAG TPA: EAL domain-containing protein [Alphaproteobacteria bacterium]|nr:EAL domain-containing protein [Alphaproteobacteria bacterium]
MNKSDVSLLIVDDDEGNRYTLSRRLKREGFEKLELAENGRQALEILRSRAFDLMLLDIMMPEMNGYEVLQTVKADEKLRGMPVIVISALTEIDSIARCIEMGAEDYLPKPFNPVLLRARVNASLEKHRLRQAERAGFEGRIHSLMGLVVDGVLILDESGAIEAANPAAAALFGASETLVGRHIGELVLDLEGQSAESGGWETLLQPGADGLARTEEAHGRRVGGRVFPVDLGMREMRDGDRRLFALSVRDLTARKQAEEQRLRDALYCHLTGLPNRSLLMDRLEHALNRTKRTPGSTFGVLFLNIDRFRVVNDSLGHAAGDQVLIGIARRLAGALRPADTLARLGSDEFVILLEDVSTLEQATACADRLQATLQQPFSVGGQDVVLTCSIGVLVAGGLYERAEDMVQDADIAMLRAKAQGKARFHVFQEHMRTQVRHLLQVESELRRAIEREDELVPYYQPIVGLQSGRIEGFEALARWRHPERGLVPPMEFIPLAEETGLIVPLGRAILRSASRQLAQWQRRLGGRGPFVAVNVSGRQIADPGFYGTVTELLREFPVAGALKLELTESVVMDNPEVTEALLRRFRDLNLQISIDDFGTGYSSLAYLHRFPIDTLKIDRSFVSTMLKRPDNLEIVRVILALAQSLRLEVVAEGVETDAEKCQLRDLGCTYGQGYLFAKPLPAEEADALLEREMVW